MITTLYGGLMKGLPKEVTQSMHLCDDYQRIVLDDVPVEEDSREFDTLMSWIVQIAANIGGIDMVRYLATEADNPEEITLIIKVDLCEEES